jgi:ribonuclease BN (tRNA processing enzyme)
MIVTFLGSGDAFGSGGRVQTCIGLRSGDRHVLVDCGATSLTALKARAIDPNESSTVVISHLHGDHFGGLPFLILDGQFARRTLPLQVAGPPGTADRLTAAMEVLYPGSSAVQRRFPVPVHELVPDRTPLDLDGVTVQGWEVDHACGTPPLAVRVGLDGAAFGYSGDTAWTPALAPAATGCDLFAAEAYTYDRPVRYHLDYAALREHAGALGAAPLVLAHRSAATPDRLADANHPAAFDGMTLSL